MANAQQIRRTIDPGHGRDKTRGTDPAVAPLGTDDEAGGHPRQGGWAPPQGGDRIVDGDPSVSEFYQAVSEEDNRAAADAPPSWRTWGFIAVGLAALAAFAVFLAS